MHEYSVASELIDALLPQAETIEGRIVGVILKKGELRILSDHAITSAFELLAQNTPLEDARLVIEPVPATVSCSSCGYQGAVDHGSDEVFYFAVPILSCPQCQSSVILETGRELLVDRLTVRTSAETAENGD